MASNPLFEERAGKLKTCVVARNSQASCVDSEGRTTNCNSVISSKIMAASWCCST